MTIQQGATIDAADILSIKNNLILSGTISNSGSISLNQVGGTTINLSGTVQSIPNLSSLSIFGNPGTTSAAAVPITIGGGLFFSGTTLSSIISPIQGIDSTLQLTSGTIGINSIPAGMLFGNPGTTSAQPGHITLGNGLAISNGTISTNGTLGTVNLSSSTGLLINNVSVIRIDSLNNTCIGFGAGSLTTTGGLNLFAGYAAGANNTTGLENTYLGYLSGQFANGSDSTGVGEHTLGYDPAPYYSTAVGNNSQRNFISSTPNNGSNTSIGKSAMYMGSGINNTAVGFSALFGNAGVLTVGGTPTPNEVITILFTVPSNALYAGAAAGITNHPVVYNVGSSPTLASIAAGLKAAINADSVLNPLNTGANLTEILDVSSIQLILIGTGLAATGQSVTWTATTTGTCTLTLNNGGSYYDNVAVGYNAFVGFYLTNGYQNIGIGRDTLHHLSSGSQNICIGTSSGYALTNAVGAILIGANAGFNSTSNATVSIGLNSLSTATAPNEGSVAIGAGALQNNTSGWDLTAIGGFALQGASGSTAARMVAVGWQAGMNVTSANDCTFIGRQSGLAVTNGNNLVLVGGLSGSNITGGYGDTIVGSSAGANLISGNLNSIFGYLSGLALTYGSSNTLIGTSVGQNILSTGNNNILIGVDSSADTPAANTSNMIIIKGVSGGTAVLSSTATNTTTPITTLGGNVFASLSLGVGGTSGPTWTSGSGAPSGTSPNGSLYSNTSGGTGARLYVSTGSAWNAVPSV